MKPHRLLLTLIALFIISGLVIPTTAFADFEHIGVVSISEPDIKLKDWGVVNVSNSTLPKYFKVAIYEYFEDVLFPAGLLICKSGTTYTEASTEETGYTEENKSTAIEKLTTRDTIGIGGGVSYVIDVSAFWENEVIKENESFKVTKIKIEKSNSKIITKQYNNVHKYDKWLYNYNKINIIQYLPITNSDLIETISDWSAEIDNIAKNEKSIASYPKKFEKIDEDLKNKLKDPRVYLTWGKTEDEKLKANDDRKVLNDEKKKDEINIKTSKANIVEIKKKLERMNKTDTKKEVPPYGYPLEKPIKISLDKIKNNEEEISTTAIVLTSVTKMKFDKKTCDAVLLEEELEKERNSNNK